jgi:RNA polymerase sigma-70 factor (ECF subfamily)
MMVGHTGAVLARSFVAHRKQLMDVAERILRCRRRAEDIVQDAFLKVLEHTDADAVLRPVAYLLSVVRNLAIDQYRRSSFECRLFADEEQGWQVATNHSAEASLWGGQCLGVLDRALSELPERTRAAFELHRIQGMTQRDVARCLGISPTLVNFMIRDALSHCQDALAALEHGSELHRTVDIASDQWEAPMRNRHAVRVSAELCDYLFTAPVHCRAA